MKIKQWRERRKLTQVALAEACNVSRSLIMLIETGRLKPYPLIRRKIAEALGVQEEDIRW